MQVEQVRSSQILSIKEKPEKIAYYGVCHSRCGVLLLYFSCYTQVANLKGSFVVSEFTLYE